MPKKTNKDKTPAEKSCPACKLHGKTIRTSRQHRCEYSDCKQFLCTLLKLKRKAMKVQQKIWRSNQVKTKEGTQLCDNCRNHGVLSLKKNHACKFKDCEGPRCQFSESRRNIHRFMRRLENKGLTCEHFEECFQSELNLQNLRNAKTAPSATCNDNQSANSCPLMPPKKRKEFRPEPTFPNERRGFHHAANSHFQQVIPGQFIFPNTNGKCVVLKDSRPMCYPRQAIPGNFSLHRPWEV